MPMAIRGERGIDVWSIQRTRAVLGTGLRGLAASVILQAYKDAVGSDGEQRAEAVSWLRGDGRVLAEGLGIEPDVYGEAVRQIAPPPDSVFKPPTGRMPVGFTVPCTCGGSVGYAKQRWSLVGV